MQTHDPLADAVYLALVFGIVAWPIGRAILARVRRRTRL